MLTPFHYAARVSNRTEALQRIVSILLQGISLHAFQYDAAEFALFQTGIRKIRLAMDSVEDEDSALLLAGSAIRLLEEHHDEAEAEQRAQRDEMEKVVALLSNALLSVGRTAPATLVRMKEIERDLAAAHTAASMSATRAHLSNLVERIQKDLADTAAGRQRDLAAGETDPITGLPDSGFCADAMSSIWAGRLDFFVAMFAVERLEAINARFGFKAGDQVLLILSQHVAQNLMPTDQLFRWRGPCVIALMHRQVAESFVLAEVNRIAGHRMEHALSMHEREVMVPISTSCSLFPLAEAAEVEDLVSRLNDFALKRAGKSATVGVWRH